MIKALKVLIPAFFSCLFFALLYQVISLRFAPGIVVLVALCAILFCVTAIFGLGASLFTYFQKQANSLQDVSLSPDFEVRINKQKRRYWIFVLASVALCIFTLCVGGPSLPTLLFYVLSF